MALGGVRAEVTLYPTARPAPKPGLPQCRVQSLDRLAVTEQLQRLEQRRRDPTPCDRNAYGPEGQSRLESQSVDQGRTQGALDRCRRPLGASGGDRIERVTCGAHDFEARFVEVLGG